MERNYIGEELVEPDEKPVSGTTPTDHFELLDDFEESSSERKNSDDRVNYFEAFDDGFDSMKKGGITQKDKKVNESNISSTNMLGEL